MFRDLKSHLGLRKAAVKSSRRLERLLLGYQLAYMLLYLTGAHLSRRWQNYVCSKPNASPVWMALQAIPLLLAPRHQPYLAQSYLAVLSLESG